MARAPSAARANERSQLSLTFIDSARLEPQIREQCGLFVFVNHSRLLLIHQTAKEFLVAQSERLGQSPPRWKSSLQESQIEREMTTICVTFLHLSHAEQSKRGHQSRHRDGGEMAPVSATHQTVIGFDEFWQYCAEYWTQHLRDDFIRQNVALFDKASSLYTTDKDLFSQWFPIMWKAVHPHSQMPKLYDQHVIAMTGHVFALEKMLDSNKDKSAVDAQDSSGRTALHWAAERGHEEAV
jgi:Ankyrin repeats (many copies)